MLTLRLAGRVSGVCPSGTTAADERMQALRASGRDIVSLGAGQIDFDTPPPIAHAELVRAMELLQSHTSGNPSSLGRLACALA